MARRPQELLYLLTRAERLAERRVQSVLDEFECSMEAWRVLDLLSDGQDHNMTALADHAFLPAPSLTKLMDRLVDQNLVHRRVDPADRRRVLARLTPRGMQRWQSMAREVRYDWRDLEQLLASEELQHLLAQLAEALEGRFTSVAARLTTGRTAKAVERAH
ncbi:MarR family winged helix-turn-helix transcriptional regulator [Streptomyces sp. NPDC059766]|uniref:MarR family winged helix-turn-helix transcriptional regulator n=1 Tax=Streptomyces sp. NPDC059766 TaxID=3346940 RepID=UPI003652D91C